MGWRFLAAASVVAFLCAGGGCGKSSGYVSERVTQADAVQLAEIIAADQRVVLVDFYADWCGPCRALSPVLAKLADKYPEQLHVVKVDVDKNQDLARKLNIQGIPFVQFYQGGKEVDSFTGALPEAQVEAMLSKYL